MKKSTYLRWLFFSMVCWQVMVACKSSSDTSPTAEAPSRLFYSQNEIFVCTGSAAQSSEASIQGTLPMQYSLQTNPNNPKIQIDAQTGRITVAADAPTGTYKAQVRASNAGGSITVDNIITFYISAFNAQGVSFVRDVKPLILAKCAPCHTNGGGRDWTILDNAKKNILKLIDKTVSGEMPQGRPPLSTAEIQIFRDWLNNCFLEQNP